jgi:PAS domain S-box-containing protein
MTGRQSSNEAATGTASGDRYGLLFELSRDAVAEIEMVEGVPVVQAVNPAFVDVFGYDPGAIVGASLNEFIVPERSADQAATFDHRTAAGEVNWATVRRKTADGVRQFLYRGVPFERDGRSHGLAIYTDITDQRRRERHHQVLHRVLRHNLRNDLSQILAATETLLAAETDEAVAGEVERIRAAAEDLEKLSTAASRVEDMLGAEQVEYRVVDAAEALGRIVDQHRRDFPAATIETELPDSVSVAADHRLSAALDALVENAVEHGHPTDGGEPQVRVTLTADASEAVVTVADDGPGIPEYERAAVFDDRSPSQLSHGSGLGLWLAKWVVESYGGRVSYERRGGETIVAARLPLADEGR